MLYLATLPVPTTAGPTPPPRTPPSWNWPAASQVRVVAPTTNDETELFLNGQSLGRKPGHQPVWDVPYAPGQLSAKGYRQGQVVSEAALRTAGPAQALRVHADRTTLAAGARGLAQLALTIVDQDGNPVPDTEAEVALTLTGPARLLGIESGDLASHEPYAAPHHRTYQGHLRVYVQATGPGAIRVALAAPGLAGQTVELRAE